jgi:hypothetical protein
MRPETVSDFQHPISPQHPFTGDRAAVESSTATVEATAMEKI